MTDWWWRCLRVFACACARVRSVVVHLECMSEDVASGGGVCVYAASWQEKSKSQKRDEKQCDAVQLPACKYTPHRALLNEHWWLTTD